MAKQNIVLDKTFQFACKIIEFTNTIKVERQYELARQLIRSGTSVGANVREAQRAESTADFKHKLKIALKEADETKYWLELIHLKVYPVEDLLFEEIEEIIKLLVTTIKNTR